MVSSDSNKKKPSVSSQPNTAALVTVAGSELDFYTNSNYLAYELPQYAAALSRGRLASDEIDDNLSTGGEGDEGGETGEGNEGNEGAEGNEGTNDRLRKRPSLSDIEVVSNEVIYDATNRPSGKIVFKVKNSSGEELKTIEVRVEKK